jgi:hypothetical protein
MARAGVALAIAPRGNYLDWGACLLKNYFEKYGSGVKYQILEGEEAEPDKIRATIRRLDPMFIAGIGHGAPCVYTVYEKEPFLVIKSLANKKCTSNKNLDLVRGRLWHLNSCLVGKELGKEMAEHYGALGFAGSVEEFLYYIGDPPCSTRASMSAFIAEYEFTKQILLGRTAIQAHKARLKAFDQEIMYWMGMGAINPFSDIIVRLLNIDKMIAVYYGKEDVRIRGPVQLITTSINPLNAIILAGGMVALFKSIKMPEVREI